MNDLWKKYREFILYLFFGGLTTLVSILSYAFCERVLGMDPLVANIISWILAVSFAYVTNRKWVFQSRAVGAEAVIKEAAAFYSGRLVTLAMEEAVLAVGIKWLGFDSLAVKIAAQVLVILANYFISKWVVFRGRGRQT
ncbi:MAG: GtrA family protein [Clostridiales bacterium]|nr:GtrA family protein [Clostridiales bacterium]